MKKICLLCITFSLLQTVVLAQKLYVKAGAGYAGPSGSQFMAQNYHVNFSMTMNSYTERYENFSGSYGAGHSSMISLGYKFNDQLGLEAGYSYLWGRTYNSNQEYTGAFTGSVMSSTYGRMSAFTSSVVITASGMALKPYARTGIIVGRPRIHNQDSERFGNDQADREWQITGKTSLGFQGGLGLNYTLNSRFGLFAEGVFTALSFTPQQATVTRYEENGQDQISSLSVREREAHYRSSYTSTEGNNQQNQQNQPSQRSNDPFAFGSAGVQVGLHVNIF